MFSVTDVFPQVSLNFAGGASMILRPQDYLLQQNSVVSIQFFSPLLFFSLLSLSFSSFITGENLSTYFTFVWK